MYPGSVSVVVLSSMSVAGVPDFLIPSAGLIDVGVDQRETLSPRMVLLYSRRRDWRGTGLTPPSPAA